MGSQESSRLYLKTDYKLHIAEDSRCTDYCRKHALSEVEQEFHEPCRHLNDVTWDRCEVLENTLTEIEVAISSENAQLRYGFLANKLVENGLTTRRNLYYAHLETGRVALFLHKFFTGKGSTISKLGTEGVSISSCTIPCSMKILREFYFADCRFFVVCGNKFLRFEMTEISGEN